MLTNYGTKGIDLDQYLARIEAYLSPSLHSVIWPDSSRQHGRRQAVAPIAGPCRLNGEAQGPLSTHLSHPGAVGQGRLHDANRPSRGRPRARTVGPNQTFVMMAASPIATWCGR